MLKSFDAIECGCKFQYLEKGCHKAGTFSDAFFCVSINNFPFAVCSSHYIYVTIIWRSLNAILPLSIKFFLQLLFSIILISLFRVVLKQTAGHTICHHWFLLTFYVECFNVELKSRFTLMIWNYYILYGMYHSSVLKEWSLRVPTKTIWPIVSRFALNSQIG